MWYFLKKLLCSYVMYTFRLLDESETVAAFIMLAHMRMLPRIGHFQPLASCILLFIPVHVLVMLFGFLACE